jgi:hypothetical protein
VTVRTRRAHTIYLRGCIRPAGVLSLDQERRETRPDRRNSQAARTHSTGT